MRFENRGDAYRAYIVVHSNDLLEMLEMLEMAYKPTTVDGARRIYQLPLMVRERVMRRRCSM